MEMSCELRNLVPLTPVLKGPGRPQMLAYVLREHNCLRRDVACNTSRCLCDGDDTAHLQHSDDRVQIPVE